MKTLITTTLIAMLAVGSLNARVTCKQMKSCAQACKALKNGHKSLDRDHDGIPCESICHRPCKDR